MGTVAEVALPLVLAFMMFTLGLGLTVADFSRVVARPRDVLVGLCMQIALLPLVAFALINVWPVSPEIAVGVMLIAVAPGGVTSNYLTSLARGDVALSVSMTAVTSLLSVATIPLILALAYRHIVAEPMSGEVSFLGTAISIFLIVTLPVALGMLFRRFAAQAAIKLEKPAHRVSTVFLVLVLAGAVLQQRDNVAAYFAEAGVLTLVLNVLMMMLALGLARLLQSGAAQQVAICMECGLQNGTLAIAVGVMLFGGGAYLIPAATYSLIMFATSLGFLWIARRFIATSNGIS